MNESPPLNDNDAELSPASSISDAVPLSVAKTPGQILREAREARGLSIEEVADVLRFSERQIAGIEQDDYQSLPGTTLVRGFLRGYAKFLRIDATPLLAQLDAAVPTELADVRPPGNFGAAGDSMSPEPMSPKLPLIFLAVILLVLAGAYWFIQSDQAAIPVPATDTVAVASESLTQTPAAEASVAAMANAGSADAATGSPAQLVAGGTESVSPATDALAAPPPGLVVEFDDLSWIEVRDANQNVIFVGEYPKGTRQVVEGKAPFSLWVGRASVVRASYKGQPIDIRSGSREDVARLTVQ